MPTGRTRNRTRKTKKGGSYLVPIRVADRPRDDYDLHILIAHGSISPEFYYVVPPNVILLMPNACGLPLSSAKQATDYLFMTPADAKGAFERDFFETAGGSLAKLRSEFTVYLPGDIMPLHQFTFDPVLGKTPFLQGRRDKLNFGFVGLFQPGGLHSTPITKDAYPYTDAPNLYNVPFKEGIYLIGGKTYYRNPFRFAEILISNALAYYSKQTDPLYRSLYPKLAPALNAIVGTAKRVVGGTYEIQLLRGDTSQWLVATDPHKAATDLMELVLPVMPENQLAPKILETGRRAFFLHEIVKPAAQPQIYLLNSCRSLHEKGENGRNWFNAANSKPVKKESFNFTKPSMSLVRTISESGKKELNMGKINAFRSSKGLPPNTETVLKYDSFRTLLEETVAVYDAEADMAYGPLVEDIQSVLAHLRTYEPAVRVAESTAAEETLEMERKAAIAALEAERAAVAAAAVVTRKETIAAEIEKQKRILTKLRDDIQIFTRAKRNANVVAAKEARTKAQETKKALEVELASLM